MSHLSSTYKTGNQLIISPELVADVKKQFDIFKSTSDKNKKNEALRNAYELLGMRFTFDDFLNKEITIASGAKRSLSQVLEQLVGRIEGKEL